MHGKVWVLYTVVWWSGDEAPLTKEALLTVCSLFLLLKCVVTLSVLLSSGQCIDRVMRLVVWGGVGGYERCMTSWCMREHCMFLTVETLPLFSVSGMCC